MHYQIKENEFFISVINLNTNPMLLKRTTNWLEAIFYDKYELAKVEIYLKKINLNYRVKQYFAPQKNGRKKGWNNTQQNGLQQGWAN